MAAKPKAPTGPDLYGSSYEQYWLEEAVEIPVEELLLDDTAAQGQIRVIEPSAVAERVASMRQAEPVDLLEVRVWESDPTGVNTGTVSFISGSFFPCAGTHKVVLSGQHSVKAMLQIRQEDLAANRDLRPWQTKVRAKVLKNETPLAVRRMIAGDSQFQQRNYKDLKLSDWATLFLKSEEEQFHMRLAAAVRASGYDRPPDVVCFWPHVTMLCSFFFTEETCGEVGRAGSLPGGSWGQGRGSHQAHGVALGAGPHPPPRAENDGHPAEQTGYPGPHDRQVHSQGLPRRCHAAGGQGHVGGLRVEQRQPGDLGRRPCVFVPSLLHSLPVLCGTWCGILASALPSHTPLFEFMTLKRHQNYVSHLSLNHQAETFLLPPRGQR